MADIAPSDMDVIDLGEAGAPVAPSAPAAADPNVVVLTDDAHEGDKLPKRAVPQDDGSVKLPLRYPVTLRFKRGDVVTDETHAELHMRRLTGADLNAIAAASRNDMSSVAIARSTRLSPIKFRAVFDRMDAADITDASDVVSHFLSSGPKTGR